MLTSSIGYIVLRTFPESLVAIFCGMLLMGVHIDKKDIVKKGFMLSLIVVFIRCLPINFAVHTILSMIVLGFILYRFCGNDLLRTVISTCVFFMALALSESIYIFIATNIFDISMTMLMDKTKIINAVVTLPSLLIVVILVIIFKKLIINKIEEYIKR